MLTCAASVQIRQIRGCNAFARANHALARSQTAQACKGRCEPSPLPQLTRHWARSCGLTDEHDHLLCNSSPFTVLNLFLALSILQTQ